MATKQAFSLIDRRATDADFSGVIPKDGMLTYSRGSQILKLGDGITVWANLPPINGANGESGGLYNSSVPLVGNLGDSITVSLSNLSPATPRPVFNSMITDDRSLARVTSVMATTLTATIMMTATAAGAVTSVNGKVGDVTLTSNDVGLGNVDNTSDYDKPVSAATQVELNAINTKAEQALYDAQGAQLAADNAQNAADAAQAVADEALDEAVLATTTADAAYALADSKLSEAPEDGKLYGRKDANWEEVVEGIEVVGGTGPKGLIRGIDTLVYEDGDEIIVETAKPVVIIPAHTGTWTSRSTTLNIQWNSVCYGNGLFVAVAQDGDGNRVMISSDGITWEDFPAAVNNSWWSVCYGNGLFVAVAVTGTGNRVMTSPDGITWTARASAANNNWWSVCYGNNIFVAVSNSGSGNRVMTSPDGINWTSRVSASNNNWYAVTFGNGMFVAVASTGVGDRVMTSPDGINWTSRQTPVDNQWLSIAFGNNMFVAVAATGTNRVMTSPDGINWTARESATETNNWYGVTFGGGLFVAVSNNGSGNRVMTSTDGITWTAGVSAAENNWRAVTYGNGMFVATSLSGLGNRVMTANLIPEEITKPPMVRQYDQWIPLEDAVRTILDQINNG